MKSSKHPIESLLFSYSSQLQQLLINYSNKPDWHMCPDMLASFVTSCISILKLNAEPSDEILDSFSKIYSKYFRGNAADLSSILAGWIISNKMQHLPHLALQKEYKAYLKTLNQLYERIAKQAGKEDLEIIQKLYEDIKACYKAVSRRYFCVEIRLVFRSKAFEIEKKGLEEVFRFYALQHLFIGKTPTFQKILDQKSIWDSGTFLAFCKQFVLPVDLDKNIKVKMLKIFKNHSDLGGVMNFGQFCEALDAVSVYTFDRESGIISTLKKHELSLEAKRVLLYEKLKFGDLSSLKNKLKQLTNVFSEKPEQKPLARSIKYKFVLNEVTAHKFRIYKDLKTISKSFIRRSNSHSKLEQRVHKRNFSLNIMSCDKLSLLSDLKSHKKDNSRLL